MRHSHKLGSIGVAGAAHHHPQHHTHHSVHHSNSHAHHVTHPKKARFSFTRNRQPKTLAVVSAAILALCVFAGIVGAHGPPNPSLVATEIPVIGRLSATTSPQSQPAPKKTVVQAKPKSTSTVVSQAVQKPQLPVNTNSQPYVGVLPDTIPPYNWGAFTFYYAGAREFATATGASVSLSQAQPSVPSQPDGDNHSLMELAVMSPDGKQVVEVGWILDKVMNGDDLPHLFVYHWIDGQTTCYDACGFVQVSTGTFPGQSIATGTSGTYSIQYANNAWNIYYNGTNVGYFPASLWGNNFTSFGFVEPFGEVALSNTSSTACVQMGNGLPGSDPGSAKISNFKLTGSNVPEALSPLYTSPSTYSYGLASATGVNIGGPGSC